ncbi:hypothetical protein KY285_010537 [Solanum tuberosum]|nr:hypothetical protein KY289_011081 [Solanum tuberosum]KAH0734830.1 hypothetical protein KY285_010537 [Solanum tuberosum]
MIPYHDTISHGQTAPKSLDVSRYFLMFTDGYSLVGKPVAVDKATQERTRPSTARVKVILDLLDKHPKKIKLFFVDKDSGKVIEHYQEFVYDNLPRYCIHCERQGHDENSCRVFLGKVGAKNQNDATDKGTDVEQYQGRDSRNNLGVVRDATIDQVVANSSEEATNFNSNNEENLENKGKSIEATRRGVGKDGVLGSPNVVVAKQDNSIAFDKDVNNLSLVPRDLNKNREHVDQQVLLTHENEFIVTEEIAGKEISPNTPSMVISNPEEAKNGLNVSKEKQKETSASKWVDLVEEEENITSPPMSKLRPQAPEVVPTSKENPYMAMTVDSFKKSLAMNTKDIGVLAKSHDPEVIVSGISPTATYDIDLGTDMSDGDDEEEMLDICFDKVAKGGDLSPRQQRSGSNKIKKKAHGRQHSWDGN